MMTPDGAVKAIELMHTCCMHCHEQIHGPCKAIGRPYFGVIHSRCIPFFHWNGYCHPFPIAVYRRLELVGSRNITQEQLQALEVSVAPPIPRADTQPASTSLSMQALARQE